MDWKDKEKLEEVVKKSRTISEVLKLLKLNHKNVGNRHRLFKYLTLYNIDISRLDNALRHSGVWQHVTKESLLEIIHTSRSLSEILRRLTLKEKGSNLMSLKKYINYFGIDISEIGMKLNTKQKKIRKWMNEEIFKEDSLVDTQSAKRRILEEELLEYKCLKCDNIGEWFGEKLTLQLEHKNGKNNDHRLENLEFLCPNCHTQTKTWGCKNICKTTK